MKAKRYFDEHFTNLASKRRRYYFCLLSFVSVLREARVVRLSSLLVRARTKKIARETSLNELRRCEALYEYVNCDKSSSRNLRNEIFALNAIFLRLIRRIFQTNNESFLPLVHTKRTSSIDVRMRNCKSG